MQTWLVKQNAEHLAATAIDAVNIAKVVRTEAAWDLVANIADVAASLARDVEDYDLEDAMNTELDNATDQAERIRNRN